MDSIHALRNAYAADICVLLTTDDIERGGEAYEIRAESNEAFCVVDNNLANAGEKWSFTHEIGHLLGGRHQIVGPGKDLCNDPDQNAHGYDVVGGQYQTMMSVNIFERIKYFSNPAVEFEGYATGESTDCNVAYVINNYAAEISTFKISHVITDDVVLTEDLVIESGLTLTVLAGKTVTFDGYVGIIAKSGAQIISNGTSSDSIKFTSKTQEPQDWKYIWLYDSDNSFQYCTFEYSNWGIYMYGYPSQSDNNVIRNCTFKYNDIGMRLKNTEAEIYDSIIKNNWYGVVLINAEPENGVYFEDNIIEDNERSGFAISNSKADMFYNTIENNGTDNHSASMHGVHATTTSDVALGGRSWVSEEEETGGYNIIKENHGAGVYVTNSSVVLIGAYDGEEDYMASHNSFYDNGTYTGTYNGIEVYNNVSGEEDVLALKNYWGQTIPSYTQFYGDVDYTEHLSSQPSIKASYDLHPLVSNDRSLTKITGGTLGDTEKKRQEIDLLRQFIASNIYSPLAIKGLFKIYHYVRGDYADKLGERNTIYGYLNDIYQNYKNIDIGKIALQLLVNERMRAGDLDEAIKLAVEGLQILEGGAKKGLLFTLAQFYIHKDRLTDAKLLFDDLKLECKEEDILVELLAGSIENAPTYKLEQPLDKNINKNKEIINGETFGFVQNYPNPFNSTTTIVYEIPKDLFVNVNIYNLQGQLVAKLVKEQQEAGLHYIQWQTFDQPSGMYFCKIEAENFLATRKFLLLK